MTLKQMIETTGQLPNTARTESGQLLELFTRKKIDSKGYIVTLWLMHGDFQESMMYYGEGLTLDEAKEDCKNKIIKGV